MPINLRLTEPAVTRFGGYFYSISNTNDTLFKRVDDGYISFSYPLDSDVVNPISALHYDGRFFYTLENVTTANTGNGLLLFKSWEIENYILRLRNTYTFAGSASERFNSQAFAIENFYRKFTTAAAVGATSLVVNKNDRLKVGDRLTLGPSSAPGDEGRTEEVVIATVTGLDTISTTTPLLYSYNVGDNLSSRPTIWFFNKFRPNDTDLTNGSGQLYSFNLEGTAVLTARKAGNEFRNVLAATFMNDPYYGNVSREFLVYVNQTNLLFIETDSASPDFLNTRQSENLANQEPTSGAVIPIRTIMFENNTLFRLQTKTVDRNNTTLTLTDHGTQYNYNVSTVRRIPSSVSITTADSVISADGVSTTNITALVRDQFDQNISGRVVSFTDDDAAGPNPATVTPASSVTAGNGTSLTQFKAGTIPKTVTVTATVT